MSEYPLEPLNKICDINPDTLSETADASRRYRYIDLSSIKEQQADLSITPEAFAELPSRARRKVRRNDVLLGTVRPNLKNFALIDSDDDDLLCSTGFAVLRSKKDISDPRFIFQAINSEVVERQLNALVTGSNYPAVNSGQVAELLIPVPPLPEQKKIAEILSGIDKATALLDAKISKLNFAKSSVCQREFSHATYLQAEEDVNKITPQKKILREVADVIDCKHRTPVYASEGYPVVRPRDVKDSGINFDQCIKTSADELESLNDGIDPRVNDIVYSRNATLGVGALIKDKTTFAIGQDVCILRSKIINPKYFYYQLNSAPFFRQVENLVSGSTFKRINLGAIRELQVITPDMSEQTRVASTLEYIDNLIASLKRSREKYTQAKVSLAQDLLSGRKRISV
jgi:type I restriction enzyme S subunit